ncbi:DUF4112 domain-containing protein [Adhaeribacter pallidiroseus]|uniref:DUF4112 domain-containing protein n=1 Tax=Adhaeribacter pallidiroseus TaxID=2072847 RepID=A0A369QAN3_9BACT|nr:DUF4112 domain-containing protein [Adhaeribacter pallidiroseus]RDC61971.1 hypothetical protein AHMF7616_00561 [Adhaeribacter pallidiroseus]
MKNTESPLTPLPDERLRWVESVARLMDSQFRFPGTSFKFGLDPILGFIPLAGTLSTYAVSGILVFTMARYGVSRKVVILMCFNIILDALLGSIPLIGNIFDFAYKANDRNVRLLRRHYQEGKYSGTGTGVLILIMVSLLLVLGLIFYGLWELGSFLWQYAHHTWSTY